VTAAPGLRAFPARGRAAPRVCRAPSSVTSAGRLPEARLGAGPDAGHPARESAGHPREAATTS